MDTRPDIGTISDDADSLAALGQVLVDVAQAVPIDVAVRAAGLSPRDWDEAVAADPTLAGAVLRAEARAERALLVTAYRAATTIPAISLRLLAARWPEYYGSGAARARADDAGSGTVARLRVVEEASGGAVSGDASH